MFDRLDFIAGERSVVDVEGTHRLDSVRGSSLNSSSDEFGASDSLSIDSNTSGQFVSVSAGPKSAVANDDLEEVVTDKGK